MPTEAEWVIQRDAADLTSRSLQTAADLTSRSLQADLTGGSHDWPLAEWSGCSVALSMRSCGSQVLQTSLQSLKIMGGPIDERANRTGQESVHLRQAVPSTAGRFLGKHWRFGLLPRKGGLP